ncbi:hypothetical protein GGR52DRAFT_216158 [Hypoxylon sp. FL1284]|nr:hypothetical protein GGR52DRAFT_216158 [Hypoxylon sp. FL1284]
MADNENITAPKEEGKTADSVPGTNPGDDKKADETPAGADSTAKRPTKHLPTHYKGMPRQWEKNQVKKET